MASIFRRMSVFRELGKHEAASLVRSGELDPLLSHLGVRREDPRVRQIADAEDKRVADAAVLAQLLAPHLQGHGYGSVPDEKIVAFEPPAEPAGPASGPLSIADMIDGMLAQERRAASKRR